MAEEEPARDLDDHAPAVGLVPLDAGSPQVGSVPGDGSLAGHPGADVCARLRREGDAGVLRLQGRRPRNQGAGPRSRRRRKPTHHLRKREEEKEDKNETFYTYERSYGSFCRAFTLPGQADTAHVKAEIKNGELTVVVPKRAAAVAKQIPVASGDKPKA